MGVPPGTGLRLGLDQNLDGLLDGDTPAPTVRIVRTSPTTLITWPTNAAGFVLETSPALPATNWVAETSVRGIVGGEFNITNTPVNTRFYRLREL